LLSAGAGRWQPVAILCSLPPDIISSIIAVLKAGCAFVPVDTQLPANKLAAMFAVVEPPLFIADRAHFELATRLGQTAGSRLICYEDHLGQPDTDPHITTEPDQLSYIYFTSGSTGVPKAIAGRLKAIDHFINWEIEQLGLQRGVKVSHLLSPVFDGSLRDIFVPLVTGGEICVPGSREVAADGQRMSRWLSEAGVEVAHLVPTMMREMLNSGLSGVRLDKLKHILLAGEPLSPKDVGRWMEEVGDGVRMWNLYGTSETTMAKFYYEVKKEDAAKKIIPIGKPMPGAAAIVVTDKGKPCPQGMIGEIYIWTPFRSLGYYNQEEQTKEVFIRNPFSQDEQDMVYKTGDLGRVLKDGNYECLGRRDNQVKIRGVRVELGEVEEANDPYSFPPQGTAQ
jgi:amino acid adenylation domain-containing protein